MNLEEVKDFIRKQTPETRIYLGCDSEKMKVKGVWYADYILVVVVHIDGRSGCKVFGEVIRERDYDAKKDKPRMRLMTEAYKLSELYLKLADVLEDRQVEVHLDLNPNEKFASNIVIKEAVGYIVGTCQIEPKVKPDAWAASFGADRYKGYANTSNSMAILDAAS